MFPELKRLFVRTGCSSVRNHMFFCCSGHIQLWHRPNRSLWALSFRGLLWASRGIVERIALFGRSFEFGGHFMLVTTMAFLVQGDPTWWPL